MDEQTKFQLTRLAGFLVIMFLVWYSCRRPSPPKRKHPKFQMK